MAVGWVGHVQNWAKMAKMYSAWCRSLRMYLIKFSSFPSFLFVFTILHGFHVHEEKVIKNKQKAKNFKIIEHRIAFKLHESPNILIYITKGSWYINLQPINNWSNWWNTIIFMIIEQLSALFAYIFHTFLWNNRKEMITWNKIDITQVGFNSRYRLHCDSNLRVSRTKFENFRWQFGKDINFITFGKFGTSCSQKLCNKILTTSQFNHICS